jgi:hypothetical protein
MTNPINLSANRYPHQIADYTPDVIDQTQQVIAQDRNTMCSAGLLQRMDSTKNKCCSAAGHSKPSLTRALSFTENWAPVNAISEHSLTLNPPA